MLGSFKKNLNAFPKWIWVLMEQSFYIQLFCRFQNFFLKKWNKGKDRRKYWVVQGIRVLGPKNKKNFKRCVRKFCFLNGWKLALSFLISQNGTTSWNSTITDYYSWGNKAKDKKKCCCSRFVILKKLTKKTWHHDVLYNS